MMREDRETAINAGAAFIESVVLLAALTITLVGVLTIYSMTWKQFSCIKIYNQNIGFSEENPDFFNPWQSGNLDWLSNSGHGGCYDMNQDGGELVKIF